MTRGEVVRTLPSLRLPEKDRKKKVSGKLWGATMPRGGGGLPIFHPATVHRGAEEKNPTADSNDDESKVSTSPGNSWGRKPSLKERRGEIQLDAESRIQGLKLGGR